MAEKPRGGVVRAMRNIENAIWHLRMAHKILTHTEDSFIQDVVRPRIMRTIALLIKRKVEVM